MPHVPGPAAPGSPRPRHPQPDAPAPPLSAVLHAQRLRLLARIEMLEADMAELVAASRDSNADDEHDPEGQTIGYERAQLAALTDAARARLAEVATALDRVRSGTHGRCETCGGPIGALRLEARPTARTCVTCAAP